MLREDCPDPCADASTEGTMSLDTPEFICRFLIHVLPKGYHRVHYYGLLASANRAANIAHARNLLAVRTPHRNRITDRDFLPWRFSNDGHQRMSMVFACRRSKTCTAADIVTVRLTNHHRAQNRRQCFRPAAGAD